MELRQWQKDCLDAFVDRRERGEDLFVFEACPGAGKSFMAAELAWQMLNDDERQIDFVVVIVPWKSIQGDSTGGMIKTFDRRGLRVRERLMLRGARIVQQPVPANLDAVVTTYAEAMTEESLDTLRLWKSKGLKVAVILDEIHHANELNGTWGDMATEIKELSEMCVVMSGTFFRTDGAPITFVDYEDGTPRLHCPPYRYAQAVSDKVCRPVAFKYQDVDLRTITDGEDISQISLSAVHPTDKRLGKIMREVYDPEGDCVRRMIHDVDEYLQRIRRRFVNAGALFTCRPGRGDSSEDKHVHQIASKIRQYTGHETVVVTHSDNNAQGKIDAFRNGSTPYLVAVNMISEGVDIPRIRAVGMMRYITSEMMFRQIVGRSVRMTDDEDGTASMVFLPKFQLMNQFGLNMQEEALQGLRDLRCDNCGQYPCLCLCDNCGSYPCECPQGEGKNRSELPEFAVLEANPIGGGGSVSADEVGEALITIAKAVMQQSPHHAHANDVQLAHAFKLAFPMFGTKQVPDPGQPTHLERLGQARKRVNRLMNRLAGKKYGGNFKECWTRTLLVPHGVDWNLVKNTWTVDQIELLANNIENELVEAFKNGH